MSFGTAANTPLVPAVSFMGLGFLFSSPLPLFPHLPQVLMKHLSAGVFPPCLPGDSLSVTVIRLTGYHYLSFLKHPKFSLS